MAADPFTISTGLCGIISLAEVVYKQGRQFLRDCKDCPGELKALVLEINGLKGALEALELLVDDAVDALPSPADRNCYTMEPLDNVKMAAEDRGATGSFSEGRMSQEYHKLGGDGR
ncbi:hypothetical protein K440DRAFT_644114 [Wilcoxina mikolae CBS 423.85]|nr:hypothetical protein K440DRAFT_644114 [Wilcoxina mikolae CBS 423.85]